MSEVDQMKDGICIDSYRNSPSWSFVTYQKCVALPVVSSLNISQQVLPEDARLSQVSEYCMLSDMCRH